MMDSHVNQVDNADLYHNDISEEPEISCPDIDSSTEEIIQRKVSKNIRDLHNFFRVNNFSVEKGDQNANIINVSERRCYNVLDDNVEEFFTILDLCRKEKRMLHWTERQITSNKTHSGIMLDFDRYQRSKDSQITDRHFTGLIRHLLRLLDSYIGFSKYIKNDRLNIHVFVTRKPSVVVAPAKIGENVVYKDGFHIVIPEIQITKALKRYFIDEIISKKILSQVFNDIDNIEPPESMMDKASACNPMHFFGNSKVDRPPYILAHAYRYEIFEDGIEREVLQVDDLLKASYNLTYELSLGFNLQVIKGEATWLQKRQFDYDPSLETKIQLMVEKTAHGLIHEDELNTIDNSVDMLTMTDPEAKYIKRLLDIIDISYATDYEKWFKVICAIANVSSRYKDLAVQFSHRKPESWSPTEIDRVWVEATSGRVHNNPVTKRSIIHWAQQSSPQRFRELNNENYNRILRNYVYENEGRVEHAMVARLLQAMISEKFIVDAETSDDNNKKIYRWYEFVCPSQAMRKGEVYKWRREADPDNVHLYISDHVSKIYREVAVDIKKRKDEAENEQLMKYWHQVEKTFRIYTSKLYDNGFQVSCIKQAQYRFRQRGFIEQLDSYEDVIGVGNGLLKLGAKTDFIRGFHEYRISKYTDTDYIPFDPTNPYVMKLIQIFKDIFPEDDVWEFMLYHASTWLDGCEAAGLLLLLVGGGQNGKSFFLKMLHNTLGHAYVGCGKIALLSSPSERAESANSAQMQMKGKRGFYFEEANKCETLNSSRLKTISSPGYQSGRDLHQRQENFKNTANPIAASNFDYIIDTTDHGTWRRIYYYKNKVKFCRNPDPKNKFEKKDDPNIMRIYPNDPNYKQAMLSILVYYNEKLRSLYGNDLKAIPVPTIEAETYEFRKRQDTIHKFITEMIVYSPSNEGTAVKNIAHSYQEWYTQSIKQVSLGIPEITAQLENSCIASKFETRINGNLFLPNHRIKARFDEPLNDGELELIPTNMRSAGAPVPLLEMNIVREKDEFAHSIEKTSPTYIQNTTDNIDSVEKNNHDRVITMDDLEALLSI